MKESDFQTVLRFICEHTGITLPETNHSNLKKFMTGRMEERGLATEAYLNLLETDKTEHEAFINTITINETYFFREEKHFTLLDRRILPSFCRERQDKFHVWSAACSSGEEAVSLLAMLHKYSECLPRDYRVYATDINPSALYPFKQGIFPLSSLRRDGQIYHSLLAPLGSSTGNSWHLHEEFKKRLEIINLNLYASSYPPFPASFEIIFLRNTLLYMPGEVRLQIIDKISRRLSEGGYLFLAMAETALISHPSLELREVDRIYFFRKKTAHTTAKKLTPSPEVRLTPPAPSAVSRNRNRQPWLPREAPPPACIELMKKILHLINMGKHEQAASGIADFKSQEGEGTLFFYLEGSLAMSKGETNTARHSFLQALDRDDSFWPARFYLARLSSEHTPSQAKQEYLICRTQIEQYIEKNRDNYQFLLEGFNARYFHSICTNWIETYNRKEKV